MIPNVSNYFNMLCYESLIEEVMTTPKPGLVDSTSSGAHMDMDIKLFIDSSRSISPYLGEMAEYGYKSKESDENLFLAIRKIGINAENAMYTATKGINTHKGAIFSLGILATAAGCLLRENPAFSTNDLFERVRSLCNKYIFSSLSKIKLQKNPSTNGEKLFYHKGFSGARGEAMKGFPSVRNISLPVLHEMLDENHSFNDSKIQALLVLMSKVEDTTVLSRVGLSGLQTMQFLINEILEEGGSRKTENIDKLYQLDTVFANKNISAGGCADLLGLTILVYKLETKQNYNLIGIGNPDLA
ncbi:triphosphoribosyl-dephospho-CoA synthase CitG [uncultured Sphaerochaeta sp.]|uniref:triphosphoribosyl-dephospho-CoA synthase CitG n=1 Tax=uncultured Sphaerochaeta sp. TaxID=886478 RepID=UPI002A0A561A|nr:triphosphoribosyl-dephospho-CoA synthase CitG [uncultured Sphaerochaeta sp.]